MVVVLFGFLVTMVCFGMHRPVRATVVLLTLFTLLVGLVIYLILAFSDPFEGNTGVDPAPIEYVLERLETRDG